MTEQPDDLQNLIKGNLDFKERYSDLKLVGEGGMGKVFLSHDRKLNKPVAIKALRSNVDPRDIVRFQTEAKVLSRLDNQYIVRVLDFVHTEEDGFFLVMEYVEGSSMESILEKSGPFPLEDAIKVTMQICSAIQHAHKQGIVHRDLKPSNIMLDKENKVRILDFGIAKLLNKADPFGTMTLPGQSIGTPMYMSPEQVAGDATDERTDIYAVGLLLFMMLTGRVPFDTEQVVLSFRQRLEDEPPPHLRLYLGETDTAHKLNDMVRKALKRDPDERYKTMEEFQDELATLLTVEEVKQITAHGVTNPVPKPAAIGFIVASLALAIGIVSYFYMVSTDKVMTPVKEVPKKKKEKSPYPEGFYGRKDDNKMLDFWFAKPELNDEDLQVLIGKPVKELSLTGNERITNEFGMQFVSTLPLTALDLSRTRVDDATLKSFAQMPKLEWLKLSSTKISDQGLKNLAPMGGRLIKLDLDNCKRITNEGLRFIIKTFPNMQWLHIGDTSVTNTAVPELAKLRNLKRLWLPSLRLRDQDLVWFRDYKWEYLDLTNNRSITDATLKVIDESPIRHLELISCDAITEEGLAAFRAKRPNCEVIVDFKKEAEEFAENEVLNMPESIDDPPPTN